MSCRRTNFIAITSDGSKQKQTDNNQVEQNQSTDIQIDEESIRAVMN